MSTTRRQQLKLNVHGLFTNPSSFADIPPGALTIADNIVLDRENRVEPRRGMGFYGQTLGDAGVLSMFTYANSLLINTTDGKLWYDSDNNGTWVAYSGTYNVPDSSIAGSRVREVESNKNLYLLTDKGTVKLDSLTGTPRAAGVAPGLGGTGTVTGTSGFLPINTYVAYRVVWGYTDANSNLILGAPSDRIIVGNPGALVNITGVSGSTLTLASVTGIVVGMTIQTSGSGAVGTVASISGSTITVTGGTWTIGQAYVGYSANVNLNFQIPQGIDGTYFYQVYRSLPSVDFTLLSSAQPNDQLQQMYEGVPTSGQLTGKTVTITDTTPQSLLQGYLYTNPNQEGILQANYQPPFANDACFYKNYTWYANTRTLFTFTLTMLASGAPPGVTSGDTLTFNILSGGSFTLTADTTENATTGHFKVFNTGNPALDIQNTATSLVRIANTYAANTYLSANYTSNFDALPGQMAFTLNTLTTTGFYITASRASSWGQVIPTSGQTSANSATNDVSPNRVYYSKELQPEAVPLLNYIEVGSMNQPIIRIIPLRDGIIVLKGGADGVFRISGTDPTSFAVTGLDNSIRILASNTAAVLDNQVFFLSDQGVVAASDNAVQIFSRPIETDILKLTTPDNYPNFTSLAFATTYNADRKYILHMPVTGTDTYCQQQFCYNTITNCWTRWTRPTLSGIVSVRDNRLYLGGPSLPGIGGWVYQERKSFTNADYADEEYSVSIVGVSGQYLTVSSTTNLQVGQTLKQGTVSQDIIAAITGSVLTMSTNLNPWTTGAANAFNPIPCRLQTVQIDADNPGIMKHFPEISFIFSEANFTNMTAQFSSDLAAGVSTQLLTPPSQGSWGEFAWGAAPWGGSNASVQTRIRVLTPATQQRASWLIISLALAQCFSSFGFSGFSVQVNDIGSRQKSANQ